MRGPVLLPVVLLAACAPMEGPDGFMVLLQGRVVDEQQEGVYGAYVTMYSSADEPLGAGGTDADGWYAVPVLCRDLVGNDVTFVAEGVDMTPTRAWVQVNLLEGEETILPAHPPQSWSPWRAILPPLHLAGEAEEGYREGLLVDAETGQPLEGGADSLHVELREGWNAPATEPVVDTIHAGAAGTPGVFAASGLPPGMYTATVLPHAELGTGSARFPILVGVDDQEPARAVVSRALATQELRVSAIWDDDPADLDLHLTGPRSAIQSGSEDWERFHVWSGAPVHPPQAAETVTVELLREAGDGYGPETIHSWDVRSRGVYRASVHHPEGGEGSSEISMSRVLVQLWIGGQEPEFFEITPGRDGNTWWAASLDVETGALYRLQDIGVVSDPSVKESF